MATDDVLNQNEVDALLAAIGGGEVELDSVQSKGPNIVTYDFKRPERVARDNLRAIQTLHELFARKLQASLAGSLRTLIDLKIAHIDQLTYSEFINSLPNPTCFIVVSCAPLEGSFILEISPVIAFPIFERLLGHGKASTNHPERALTEIEWRLLQTIVDKALTIMTEVWSSIHQIDFSVTTRESNPQLVHIMSTNEPIVSISIEVLMGEYHGFINICIPVVSIEPIMGKVVSHTWVTNKRREDIPSQKENLSHSLACANINLVANAAETTIKVSDLMNLAPGDIITTEHRTNEPILVKIEGKPKFFAQPGSIHGHNAFRVTQYATKDDGDTFK